MTALERDFTANLAALIEAHPDETGAVTVRQVGDRGIEVTLAAGTMVFVEVEQW